MKIFQRPLRAVELDEGEGPGPQDVVVDAVDLVVEVRPAPEVILDGTVWDIPRRIQVSFQIAL